MDERPAPLPPSKIVAGNGPADEEISLDGDGDGDQVVPGGETDPEAQPDCAELVGS